MIPLSEISFDEQDESLFLVQDKKLRADALQHSILPRLHFLLNAAISETSKLYGVDVFDDSIVTYYPHFRTRRKKDLNVTYHSALVGLGGKRTKNYWHGLARKDGKPVQILPFRFAYFVSKIGGSLILENRRMSGLTNESIGKLLEFHIEHEPCINALCRESGMHLDVPISNELKKLCPAIEYYKYKLHHKSFEHCFLLSRVHFPINELQLQRLIDSFVTFFPVYDAYLQIARGAPSRFSLLLNKLNDWLESNKNARKPIQHPLEENIAPDRLAVIANAAMIAEKTVRVMPAIRWQVFQRDGWKCVACGRNAHDNVVLHIDHITPRSKGGKDEMSNYQTLCNLCNIGKSNRDSTPLHQH